MVAFWNSGVQWPKYLAKAEDQKEVTEVELENFWVFFVRRLFEHSMIPNDWLVGSTEGPSWLSAHGWVVFAVEGTPLSDRKWKTWPRLRSRPQWCGRSRLIGLHLMKCQVWWDTSDSLRRASASGVVNLPGAAGAVPPAQWPPSPETNSGTTGSSPRGRTRHINRSFGHSYENGFAFSPLSSDHKHHNFCLGGAELERPQQLRGYAYCPVAKDWGV